MLELSSILGVPTSLAAAFAAAFLAGMFLKRRLGWALVVLVSVGFMVIAGTDAGTGGERMALSNRLLSGLLFAVVPLVFSFAVGVVLSTVILSRINAGENRAR